MNQTLMVERNMDLKDSQTSLEQKLETFQLILELLEKETAKSGILQNPTYLEAEVEQKRREVASCKARLAQLQGTGSYIDTSPEAHPIFIGREYEIIQCLEALDPNQRGWGVVLEGGKGIGKTALALEVVHETRRRGWFDAYVFCSGKSTNHHPAGTEHASLTGSSLDAFIRELALALGSHNLLQITNMQERRKAMLKDLTGRRILLCWDNLEKLNEEERRLITSFLQKLPASNKAIITSRHRHEESALTVHLGHLSKQEAFQLIEYKVAQRQETLGPFSEFDPDILLSFYRNSGGSPQIIQWSFTILDVTQWDLQEALQQFSKTLQGTRVNFLTFRQIMECLKPLERDLLAVLFAYQEPVHHNRIAENLGLSLAEIKKSLQQLFRYNFIFCHQGKSYILAPVIREFLPQLKEEKRPNPLLSRQIYQTWVQYVKKYGGGKKNANSFHKIREEYPLIEGIVIALKELSGIPNSLNDKEAAYQLICMADALCRAHGPLFTFGYWEELIKLSIWAYTASQKLGMHRNAGWHAYEATYVYYNRGDFVEANLWSRHMIEAMNSAGNQYDQAVANRLVGLLASQNQNLEKAERHYQQALVAYQALGKEKDQAGILNDLGNLSKRKGNYEQARKFYLEGLQFAEKIDNQKTMAFVFGNLGRLSMKFSFLEEAENWYNRQLETAQKNHQFELVAKAKVGIARLLEERQEYVEALPFAEEALHFYERQHNSSSDQVHQLVARLWKKSNADF